MPKMKTAHGRQPSASRSPARGKIVRRKAFRNHILEKKSSTRTRRLGREAEVAAGRRARRSSACSASSSAACRTRPRTRKEHSMARVKRAVHGKKHRRAVLEQARATTATRAAATVRQRAGHALAAVRVPRPPGAQGRLPPAVDPAHQRRRPPARHELQPLHHRPAARPGSRSTARSSPTSPSPTPRRSPRWSKVAAGEPPGERREPRADQALGVPPPEGRSGCAGCCAAARPRQRGAGVRGRGRRRSCARRSTPASPLEAVFVAPGRRRRRRRAAPRRRRAACSSSSPA